MSKKGFDFELEIENVKDDEKFIKDLKTYSLRGENIKLYIKKEIKRYYCK